MGPQRVKRGIDFSPHGNTNDWINLETGLPYKFWPACRSAAGAHHGPVNDDDKKGEEGGIHQRPANRVPCQPHLRAHHPKRGSRWFISGVALQWSFAVLAAISLQKQAC